MAAAFVGLNVSVKLKEPPVSLHGLVSDVKGQRLYLTDVNFLKSGKHLKEYTIHGAEIADIEVLPLPSESRAQPDPPEHFKQNLVLAQSLHLPSSQSSILSAAPQPFNHGSLRPSQLRPQSQQFADPAILSFARNPNEPDLLGKQQESSLKMREGPPSSTENSGQTRSAHEGRIEVTTAIPSSSTENALAAVMPHALLSTADTPLEGKMEDYQTLQGDPANVQTLQDVGQEVGVAKATSTDLQATEMLKTTTRRRKRGKGKPKIDHVVADDLDTSPEYVKKGIQSPLNGWRETPILQREGNLIPPNPTRGIVGGNLGRQTAASSSKKSRRRKDLARETANGWATEDATDVRGMGDFDFEANLSKFDKLAVWDELRNDDTTADEDRLVSLNRVKPPTPGSFGGKKLLPSENVLDRPRVNSRDFDLDRSEDDMEVGPAPASRRKRRDASKSSLRRLSSNRADFHSRADIVVPLNTAQRSLTNRSLSQNKRTDSHSGTSPRVQAISSPASSSIFSPTAPDRNGPCLRYLKNDHACRTMTSETLEAVENLAHNGYGMSEDVLAENAGRGIAEIALSTINPKGHRLGQPNHNSLPVVVVVVGDNKAGGRALAAARHLLERGVRVVASLTGSVDLEDGPLSSQIHRFRGKFLRTWTETSAYLKTLDAPPELIVDALLGAQASFDDLQQDHLTTAIDMITWANKSRASVLAVDIPSGVDRFIETAESGQSEPIEMKAKIVVCCGAPCTGLLNAMGSRQNQDEWRVFVVDIGLNPAARPFLKVNTNKEDSNQRGKYIQFGSEWVVGIRYDAGILGV